MGEERPPGPDFDLEELEAIAWKEAGRSPGLAPNGGRRWTSEDNAFAVSILAAEMRTRGFRKARDAGMARTQAGRWLLKALHNGLLKHVVRNRRMELLDDLGLDTLPSRSVGQEGLAPQDRPILVEKVLARLAEGERATAADYFRGDGIPVTESRAGTRSRERHRARLREVARAVVREAGLTREEALDLVAALAAKLTGGGRELGKTRESMAGLGPLADWFL